MKKKWTRPRYKRFVRSRQRYEAKKKHTRCQPFQRSTSHHGKPLQRLNSPEHFSLLNNPNETLSFLHDIRRYSPVYSLRVNLHDVNEIDAAAVAALVACIKSREITIHGNQPQDLSARDRLHDFGFFEHVRGVPTRANLGGTIRREGAGRNVDARSLQSIVGFGMKRLGKSPKHGPSYSIFSESVSNTFQHAHDSAGHKPWWASVHYDDAKHRACFTAIDHGIGILDGLQRAQRLGHRGRRLAEVSSIITGGKWSRVDNSERLEHLIAGGTIPSRTGQPHRGKGLPSMRRRSEAGLVENLVIISNDVFGRVYCNDYRLMDSRFPGVIVYWEVG